MSNTDKVLEFVRNRAPGKVTNSYIGRFAGVQPHQQVFQITRRLRSSGKINGEQIAGEWHFWAEAENEPSTKARMDDLPEQEKKIGAGNTAPRNFEVLAAEIMGGHFGKKFSPERFSDVRKEFDFVSEDGTVVGDAKYYTLVRGTNLPPAKFSIIAEHVWLLEKTSATRKFLVFGNDRRVPEKWLERYGNLVTNVEFFFLADTGELAKLPK